MRVHDTPPGTIPDVVVDYIPPRVTSAIIAATDEQFAPFRSETDPKNYVIDKALNYGNSGGPIILENGGRAIAVCTRFQPQQMKGSGGAVVPSLYGIASSIANVQSELASLGIRRVSGQSRRR
jgi:hypothetical protein